MKTRWISRLPVLSLLVALAGTSCGPRTGGTPPAATPQTVSSPAATSPATTSTAATSPAATSSPVQWDNEWARGAVFYEVFVRSFRDSNGDGVGDLPGLIEKLDYLNDGDPATTGDLGVNAIWLMPIFVSPSYHGYDTVDYGRINPDYGTEADFDQLIAEAHRRGIRVILDFVMNHCSAQHPWFVKAASLSSEYRNWFVWRRDDPGWTQPWGGNNPTWHQGNGGYYYGVFWGGMPDLNFRNPKVRRAIEGYADLWLERGADGFRLDATRHLIENGPGQQQVDQPETHEFLKEFSADVRRVKPQALLVGENWTDTPIIATYYGSTSSIANGDELPVNFNFPLAGAILEAVQSGEVLPVTSRLVEMKADYPGGVMDAPFLTNHDMVRVATQIGDDRAGLRLAASILLTLQGSPFLYYGEEVGLQNGPTPNDEAKRTPMPWDSSPGGGFTTGSPWFAFAPGRENANVAAETGDPASLWSHYRNLVHVRAASGPLRRGIIEVLTTTPPEASVLAFLRKDGPDQVLVVHNLGRAAVTVGPLAIAALELPALLADGSPGTPEGTAGAWSVAMPPRSSGAWKVRQAE